MPKLGESQEIAEAFFADLMASFDKAHKCFEPLYLAFGDGSGDSVFGVNTHPGYIFDDLFWDIFHAHPLHVCHVTRLTDGPQFDEERVFEIRFKVSEERLALEATLEAIRITLDDAVIEHSGRTLEERVADLAKQRDDAIKRLIRLKASARDLASLPTQQKPTEEAMEEA